MLGDDLDDKVQAYVKHVRDGGSTVSSKIVIAAAKGILRSCNHSLLSENGGPMVLTCSWVQSVLKRMKFIQRKGTTTKSKILGDQFRQLRADFLEEVHSIVTLADVPAELVLNWDQTGIRIIPLSSWTMARHGSKHVETHVKKHWSNEEATLQYVKYVIVPYVEQVRFDLGCETALVIIKTTQAVIDLLELNDILVCLLPPNTTDALQPMDLSVNKPVK